MTIYARFTRRARRTAPTSPPGFEGAVRSPAACGSSSIARNIARSCTTGWKRSKKTSVSDRRMTIEDLLDRLQEFDLLLDTDPKFPSVTGLTVGDTGGRSWWAHPQAKQMYALSCALRDHPDVLMVKLISGKVTYIHRPLWPAIVAIGTAREPWQMDGLSKEAKALLKKTDGGTRLASSGYAVRELEARLLAHAA